MLVLAIVFTSLVLQIAAAAVGLRINRITGRSPAWVAMGAALVLMALRRLYLLVEYAQKGFPSYVVPNEILALVISGLLLIGMILTQRILKGNQDHAARLEETRAQALAERDKLSALMAATPIPTWIAEDVSCRVIHGNPAAAALLRMPEQANASKSAPEGEAPTHFELRQGSRVLSPEAMPMQRAAQAGEEIRGELMDLVFSGGDVRHLSASAIPLRDSEGRITGAVCNMVDVTEIRQAQEALAKAQKMESLGMLAGGLAHDFNNIFQAMGANLEMARAAVDEDSRSQLYLQRLHAGLERASLLSRDILHCSGGDLRRPEYVDLVPLVAQALDHLGRPVVRDFSETLPKVLVDPVLMGRVVEGLVTNALEASAETGVIRVRTYLRSVTPEDLATGHWPEPVELGSHVVLEVADQGHGMDSGMLPRIFDPFFSTRDLGRGLGLAAALGILRGHRAGIQVESILGVGSVFRVHLPAPEHLDTPRAVPVQSASSRSLLLLADDEEELREVLSEMLEDWFGLEVVSVPDGQEALEVFSQRPEAFDLVLLDATMPRMGGVEAFKAMRAVRPGVVGILCSGYALPVSREQAQAQGFADFLKKPFTSAEMEGLLKRVLGVGMK